MNKVKDDLKKIKFKEEQFRTPIAYSFMYIQWEANIVSANGFLLQNHYLPLIKFLHSLSTPLIRAQMIAAAEPCFSHLY